MIRLLLFVATAFAVGAMIGPNEVVEVASDAFRPFGVAAISILGLAVVFRLLVPSRKCNPYGKYRNSPSCSPPLRRRWSSFWSRSRRS